MMDWMYGAFGPTWWIWMAAGWVLYFAIGIYLAYHAHKDAVRRGLHSPEFWLVFVLLLNVVGYLVYILVRGNYASPPEATKTTS